MSDKSKKKVTLDKNGLLNRLDLIGYEAYKKLLDLEDGKIEQPFNRMSINVVRLDYILPLPILLYTFDIHQKIKYEVMNRNKDEELAYIKLTSMEDAYEKNDYTLIEYTVIPFEPDFDGIMTKKALKKAVEDYNKLYEKGQKQLFASKTSKKKNPGPTCEVPPCEVPPCEVLPSEVFSATTSQVCTTGVPPAGTKQVCTTGVPPANVTNQHNKLIEYAYEIPNWILKKNKRKEQLLEKIKTKENLRKLNYINNDVDIKSLIGKFPGHEQDFVIVEDDKEGYIRMRYKGNEPTIKNEILKLNNQPVMEHIRIFQEGEQDYDHKKDRRQTREKTRQKRRKTRQTRRKRRQKFDFKKVKREKKERKKTRQRKGIRFFKLDAIF